MELSLDGQIVMLEAAAELAKQHEPRWPKTVSDVDRIAHWGIHSAAFIAACSPDAVLRLICELKRLQQRS